MRPAPPASPSTSSVSDWSTMPSGDSSVTWVRQHSEGGIVKFRRRSSVMPRAPWPNGIERTEPLRGQLWTRSERALREPDVPWGWRALAIAVAALEAALLVWLWFGPALAISSVQVTGAHHLTSSQVAGFICDSCGNLTMIAKKGWKVYFGRVLTPEEFATLRDKLTALKAIAGNHNVDYSSPDLLYINVMNPSEPAVGYKSRQPVAASPSPGATPKPAPIPTPGPCK